MKKLLSLFLILALSVSLCIPAYAAVPSSSNNVISFEEYNAAVRTEYARHHIKYECTSYDKNFVFTKELLKQKLEDIEKTASGFTYDTSTNSFVDSVPALETAQGNISPYAIIGAVTRYKNETAKSPSGMGSANILVTIKTHDDISLGKFVAIDSCTSRQYGGAVNFQSWTDTGNSLSISTDRNWVNGFINGTLVIAYTEKLTGMNITYTSDHSILIGISQ